MGYIEETGAAQYYRDARITTIYEGTTGIQANDLIGRKTARDGGNTARSVAGEIARVAAELAAHPDAHLRSIGKRLAAACADLNQAIDWVVGAFGTKPREAHAGAIAYLRLWGLAVGGWQLGRAALVAARHLHEGVGDARFLRAKIVTARYFAECLLPQANAWRETLIEGGEAAVAMPVESF
jgi:GNAT superfamily N-acetyltransferase